MRTVFTLIGMIMLCITIPNIQAFDFGVTDADVLNITINGLCFVIGSILIIANYVGSFFHYISPAMIGHDY